MKVGVRLAKYILAPLGITAAASAVDAGNPWFWDNYLTLISLITIPLMSELNS